MKLLFSLFCRDIQAQMSFYQQLLGWPERETDRSPIYRALQSPNSILGFHAPQAFELLGLADRVQLTSGAQVTAYATIQLDSTRLVEELAAKALQLGGRVLKGPFPTYYGQWQVVLSDPEDHVFRLACWHLPRGVDAPILAIS